MPQEEIKADTSQQLLCCLAGEAVYCLESGAVRAVQQVESLRRNPAAASQTDAEGSAGPFGWVTINQAEIPVHRLATRLGLRAKALNAGSRIILLQTRVGWYALLVEQIKTVIRAPRKQLFPLPAALTSGAAHFFHGIVNANGLLMLWLRLENLPAKTPAVACPSALLRASANLRTGPVNGGSEQGKRQAAYAPQYQGRRLTGSLLIFPGSAPDPAATPVALGVALPQVLEIIEPPALVPVPGAPAYVCGLLCWRDRPLPVFDLSARMGLSPLAGGEKTRLVIVQAVAQTGQPPLVGVAGLLIRSNVKMVSPGPQSVKPLAEPHELPLDEQVVYGVYDLDGYTLVVPDLGELLKAGSGAVV